MNQQELESFCSRWLASWSGNHPEDLLAFYSEDVFYRDPGGPEGVHGKAALRRYFEKLLAANPNWKWEMVELMPTEKGFTLKWRTHIPAGDTPVVEEGLDIVELENGHITRNEVYFDRTGLLQAMRAAKSLLIH